MRRTTVSEVNHGVQILCTALHLYRRHSYITHNQLVMNKKFALRYDAYQDYIV